MSEEEEIVIDLRNEEEEIVIDLPSENHKKWQRTRMVLDEEPVCTVEWSRTNKLLRGGIPGFGDGVDISLNQGESFERLVHTIAEVYIQGAKHIGIPRPGLLDDDQSLRHFATEDIEAACFAENMLMGLTNPDESGNDLKEGIWMYVEQVEEAFTLPEILGKICSRYYSDRSIHQWLALDARLSRMAQKDEVFAKAVKYDEYLKEVRRMGEKIEPNEQGYPDETYCLANPQETELYGMIINAEFHIALAMAAGMDIGEWYKLKGEHNIMQVLEI